MSVLMYGLEMCVGHFGVMDIRIYQRKIRNFGTGVGRNWLYVTWQKWCIMYI
uniref:Uncharacterized protein MANES_07G070900 n=1 Tax=Rhizophora mucronata TaxID=61149 RepID=A0A2P2JLX9_RHIMU